MFWAWAFRHIREYYSPQNISTINYSPLAARYNWCQGPVLGRGLAVEKHCSRWPYLTVNENEASNNETTHATATVLTVHRTIGVNRTNYMHRSLPVYYDQQPLHASITYLIIKRHCTGVLQKKQTLSMLYWNKIINDLAKILTLFYSACF
jgi:hypothetical protein